jgi:RNA polymerase sigma-70 factor (ECF subfamily)
MTATPQSDVLAAVAAVEVVAPGDATTAAASLDTHSDTSLMLRYRDGDTRAFELLYARHKGPLYRYLQRTCHNPEVANDLFQEVWSKVIASRERYEVRAQFNTFLFRIAHNCTIDYFRRANRQQSGRFDDVDQLSEQLPGSDAERPEVKLSELQVRAAFGKALQQLPPEQRDTFLLHEETGLSLEEIGKITGVAMDTAKSRLRYALAKLRAALQQHQPGNVGMGAPS